MDPVILFCVGPFGRAVAESLRKFRTDIVGAQFESDQAIARQYSARIYAVASWRPAPELFTAIHETAQLHKRPFLPLLMDGKTMQLGPVTVPKCGPCWNCWERRTRQHDQLRRYRSALSAHYAANPNSGPQGFLTPFAMIGAARLAETIDGLDAMAPLAGQVWRIDMITRQIATGAVVGIHGCTYCGEHRRPDTRSFAQMRDALAYLWPLDR